MPKRVVVFDLDETVINSSHRVPNNPDGTLNLELYLKMKCRRLVMRDSLLPLVNIMRSLCRRDNYIVICTARQMAPYDYEYLLKHNITAHKIFSRSPCGKHNSIKDADLKARWLNSLRSLKQFSDVPWFMFDDATPVIKRMREENIICLNSIKVNERLMKT